LLLFFKDSDIWDWLAAATAAAGAAAAEIWADGGEEGVCLNEGCHTNEWVVSYEDMSHVTHMIESCYTYQWVISHVWMSHVPNMNESCHSCGWVMSHMCFLSLMWMS